jgi:hypothetical protein
LAFALHSDHRVAALLIKEQLAFDKAVFASACPVLFLGAGITSIDMLSAFLATCRKWLWLR